MIIDYNVSTPSHVEMYRNLETDDGAALKSDDMYPIEAFMTNELGQHLLDFMNLQIEVMKLLKIHHLSELTQPMEELHKALTHVFDPANEFQEDEEVSF